MTWHTDIADFGTHQRAAGMSPETVTLRRYQLARLAEEVAGSPRTVTTGQVEGWLAGHDWCSETRRSHRSAAVTFFAWLHRSGRRGDDPTAGIPHVAGKVGRPRPCPESAVRRALMAADERTQLMVMLAAGAGLRRGEVARVRSEHVEDTIEGPVLRVVGKGGRVRVVPVTDELARRVRECGGWCFPSPRGGHLTPAHVGKLIVRVLPTGWTTHTLRHRFASRAYLADRDLLAVRELLGHSSVATTQVYTAVPGGAARRAVEAAA